MNIDFTTTAMLASIKRRAMIPTSQVLFQDSDLLSILTEELQSDIVPLILSVREDHFVHNYDVDIDATVNRYAIHLRAFGQKLKDLVLLNDNDREVNIPRANPSSIKQEQAFGYSYPVSAGRVFFFEGDEVVIFPDTATLGGMQLRQKIYRRPNNLVAQSAAGQITAIDTTTKVLTLGNVPNTWTAASVIDIIKGTPGFKSRGDDLALTAVDATAKTVTLSAAVPSGVVVGDWVSLAGESPIPQIPYETHHILAQRGMIKVLEDLGDQSGLQAAADVYKDMVSKFLIMMSPRADDSPKRLVSASPLFGEGRRNAGWW